MKKKVSSGSTNKKLVNNKTNVAHVSYKPSKTLIRELESFIEYVPPRRLSRNLRNFYLEFIPQYVQHSVPIDFEDIITDLYFLLEFLDKAGEELLEYEMNKK